MSDHKMLKTGVIGSAIAALFCFTPVLAVLAAALGMSALVGYLDYLLYPALGLFMLLTVWALWRRRAGGAACEKSRTG